MPSHPGLAERLVAEEPIAFDHEHARALAAARSLVNLLELTGAHDADRQAVVMLTRRLAAELARGSPCPEKPPVTP